MMKRGRKPKLITFEGQTHDVKGWAKCIGISRQAMSIRFAKHPLREALLTPKDCARVNNPDGCMGGGSNTFGSS